MDLKCQLCEKDFDLVHRIPKILQICCGGSICIQCVKICLDSQGQFTCPLDAQTIYLVEGSGSQTDDSLFPDDYVKIELLKLRSVQQQQAMRCKKHANDSENLHTKCKACQTLNRDNILKEKGSNKLVEKQKTFLNQGLRDLNQQSERIEKVLEEGLNKLLKISSEKFKQIRRELNNQEVDFADKLRSFMAAEKSKLKNSFGVDSLLRRSIHQRLSELEERPNAVSEDEALGKKIQFLVLENHENEYSKTLQELGSAYETSCDQKFQQLPKFSEFGLSEFSKGLNQIFFNKYNNENEWIDVTSLDLSGLNIETKDGCVFISAKKERIKVEDSGQPNFDIQALRSATQVFCSVGGYLECNEKVQALSSAWSLMDSLLYLTLDFKDINDTQLNSLPIIQKRELQGIKVNLSNCFLLSDNAISSFLQNLLKSKGGLKALNLGLDSTKINIQTLAFLSNFIPTLTHLEELALSFRKTAISDPLIGPLFQKMEKLKKFELNLYHTNVTDDMLAAFVQNTLSHIKNLEDLALDFSSPKNPRFTGAGISKIFIPMPNLKRLSLNLGKVFTLKDEHLQALASKTLANLENLIAFELDLKENHQVTDQTVKLIVKGLKRLHTFRLNLSKLPKITDDTLTALSANKKLFFKNIKIFQLNLEETGVREKGAQAIFASMPNIESFELNLNNNKNIGDSTLDRFTEEALTNMKKSTELKLGFAGTKVSDESVLRLFRNLRNYRDFQTLHLDFKSTAITDKSVQLLLEKILTQLKNMKILRVNLEKTQVSQELQQQLLKFNNTYI